MKSTKRKTILALCAALPVFLFLTGCNNKDETTAPVSTMTSHDTNTVTNAPIKADNTGQNVRDRDAASVTPLDQGNSEGDRATTQKIRQSVVTGTNDFSMTAKNVKIITLNGKVTLRGPVSTDAEKASIVAIAKNIAGDANVDDQLEVKTNPNP